MKRWQDWEACINCGGVGLLGGSQFELLSIDIDEFEAKVRPLTEEELDYLDDDTEVPVCEKCFPLEQ